MCGRYVIHDEGEIEEINKILRDIGNKYAGTGITAKTGEILPTNNAPVLSVQDGKPTLSLMRWGFPKWDGKGVIINAKSETASEKKMFANAIVQRRCVIPSTGFYEWAKMDGKTKCKYQFNAPDSPMLYMAGIYADNPSHAEDEILTERFVILTRAANASVRDIHDRMPVILCKDELIRWLTDYNFADFAERRDDMSLVGKKAS